MFLLKVKIHGCFGGNKLEENKNLDDAIGRLDFMISQGYVDITEFLDEDEFNIIKAGYEMWKKNMSIE